ncbi:MAG TPA: hypothetical protein VGM18_05675 [Candidatus Sulfotelmatobacter sp.]|jgi:hypothetical protein
MDEEILKQIFDELFASLEPLETQNAALLQFLKAKGIATDEKLAPFLEAAGNASNVRWRAVRVRTDALISSALKPAEKPVEAPAPDSKETAAQPSGEADKADNNKAQSEPEKPDAAVSDSAPQQEASQQEASQKESPPEEISRKEVPDNDRPSQKKEAA